MMSKASQNDRSQSDDGADDSKPAGALARGLRVLVGLNDLETATISRLVEETGLAKPTVIRLLQTLLEEGYAYRDPETQTYGVTRKVASLSRGLIGRNEKDDAIRSVLDSLGDDLKWPTEYLVRDGNMMVIQTNNRERAHIRLKLFERRRFGFLESGAGIAHLSSLPASEQTRWVERLTSDPAARKEAHQKLAHAAERGFAHRSVAELAPQMCVISVAVEQTEGALSLLYFDDVVSDEILLDYISTPQECSRRNQGDPAACLGPMACLKNTGSLLIEFSTRFSRKHVKNRSAQQYRAFDEKHHHSPSSQDEHGFQQGLPHPPFPFLPTLLQVRNEYPE